MLVGVGVFDGVGGAVGEWVGIAEGAPEPAAPAMITLDPERRAKLVSFIEANKRMPKQVKKRILSQLEKAEVPKEMVDRLEGRMGG